MEAKGGSWVYSLETGYLTEPGAMLVAITRPVSPLCTGVTDVHDYASHFNKVFGDLKLGSMQAVLLAESPLHSR